EKTQKKLLRILVDLIGTYFSQVLDISAYPKNEPEILLSKVLQYIESNLDNPNLKPPQIAASHFISTRYLHLLFKKMDYTISEWIRKTRLERAHLDLTDPNLSMCSIAEIGAKNGYIDSTQFSR